MNHYYAQVEQEIVTFVDRCQDLMNSFNTLSSQSSTACLTDSSFDTCSLAVKQLNVFIDLLSSQHTADVSIKYEEIISIVSHSSDLVHCIDQHDHLLIEYALDDYLYLDEHLNDLYERVLIILDHLCHWPFVNFDTHYLEKHLRRYLPHTYRPAPSPSLAYRIGSTLIDRTSRLCASSYSVPSNDHDDDGDDDDHDSIIPSSGLLSSTPVSIHLNDEGTYASHNDHSRSLVHLDKINIHTGHGSRGQSEPSWDIDLRDLEQIEDDLNTDQDWMSIERELLGGLISVWSHNELAVQTITPWSSGTFWRLIMHLKGSEMNTQSEFILIIQWCFCLLTIQAFNRDWDLLYSQSSIHAIMVNRWRIVRSSNHLYLSSVGQSLNQIFLRLIEVAWTLQYMIILSSQSSHLTSFMKSILSTTIHNLIQRIEGTFHVLILWLDQSADAFINSNALERTLVICQSDQLQLSRSSQKLIDLLKELNIGEPSLKSTDELYSSCQSVVKRTMSKFYLRIQMNTRHHFSNMLPLTTTDWRTTYQQTSPMMAACEMILKSILNQSEYLDVQSTLDVYERILASFTETWTSILLERKYRFSNDSVDYLQRDYEYLQVFLSTNATDPHLAQILIQSASMRQIALIIDLLRTGEKQGSHSSTSYLPNGDKWLQSREPSSPFFDFIQSTCCCQKRNRVTTGS